MTRKKKVVDPTAPRQALIGDLDRSLDVEGQKEIARLNEELLAQKVEHDALVERMTAEFAELEKKYKDLDADYDVLESEKDKLEDELAAWQKEADVDAEDLAVAMHKEVEADYFHARDFEYKQRLKEMGQAAIDRMRPRA